MTTETRLDALERRVARLEGWLVTPPDTIPTSGDATGALAAWFASLPPGTTADMTGRTYRADGSLTLTGARGLTIEGLTLDVAAPSPELDKAGRSTRRHVWLRSCTGITLEGLTVTGGNVTDDAGNPVGRDSAAAYRDDREWEHGVAVEDCTDITIDRPTVDGVFGDGIYLRRSTGVTVRQFDISRNGRQGIAMVSGNGYKLLDGNIRHSRRSGIDIEPNTNADIIGEGHDVWAGDPGVEIGNVTVRSRLVPLTAGGPGTVKHVHIHDMTVIAGGVPTLSLVPNTGGRRDDWLIERWTTITPAGSPAQQLRLVNADRIVVRDFTAPCIPSRAMTGVLLRNTGRVTLEQVRFPGAAKLVTIDQPATNHELTVIDCAPTAPNHELVTTDCAIGIESPGWWEAPDWA